MCPGKGCTRAGYFTRLQVFAPNASTPPECCRRERVCVDYRNAFDFIFQPPSKLKSKVFATNLTYCGHCDEPAHRRLERLARMKSLPGGVSPSLATFYEVSPLT
jgi:hypothetical protein